MQLIHRDKTITDNVIVGRVLCLMNTVLIGAVSAVKRRRQMVVDVMERKHSRWISIRYSPFKEKISLQLLRDSESRRGRRGEKCSQITFLNGLHLLGYKDIDEL